MTLDNVIRPDIAIETLGTGYGFTEGPAADGQGNIYFSDGQNNSIYFYEVGRPVTRFVNDSTDANGMMFNSKGELYVCEGAAYRIVAIDVATRQKRVLCQEIDGQHFNEPNDLAIDHRDGFYFSDPNYQHRGQPTVMKQDVYYCCPAGRVTPRLDCRLQAQRPGAQPGRPHAAAGRQSRPADLSVRRVGAGPTGQ